MIQLLDTTAFSAAMRLEEGMVAFLKENRPGELAVAPPVVAELEYGIRRLGNGTKARMLLERRRDDLLDQLRLLDWTPEASRNFGRIKAELEHVGTPIDDLDVAIAAIALAHEAYVVTANLVHFRRIGELHSVHWENAS
jgi:tRNA(fMet)-specific endonuclease VapC